MRGGGGGVMGEHCQKRVNIDNRSTIKGFFRRSPGCGQRRERPRAFRRSVAISHTDTGPVDKSRQRTYSKTDTTLALGRSKKERTSASKDYLELSDPEK